MLAKKLVQKDAGVSRTISNALSCASVQHSAAEFERIALNIIHERYNNFLIECMTPLNRTEHWILSILSYNANSCVVLLLRTMQPLMRAQL